MLRTLVTISTLKNHSLPKRDESNSIQCKRFKLLRNIELFKTFHIFSNRSLFKYMLGASLGNVLCYQHEKDGTAWYCLYTLHDLISIANSVDAVADTFSLKKCVT